MQGQFSLLQVVELLKHSKFYVGSDTSIAHFSAAIGLKTVVILGGGHFGRFFPYPDHKNVHTIYKKKDCYNCNWKCTKKTNECIKEIEVKAVEKILGEIDPDDTAKQVVSDNKTYQPFNLLKLKGSKPKIDLLLPPSNNHSWHLKEAWVLALRSAGLLNKAFYLTGQNYNHFFEYINKGASSDFIVALGGDHHLHFLNDTPQKQELWRRYKNPKVCYSYESSRETFYDVYKQRTDNGLNVFSHYIAADENDVTLYKKQNKKAIWFPQFADDRFFRNIVPFEKRKNVLFFKGKLWTEYIDRKNILDAIVNSGLCELVEEFLTNGDLAECYNKYTATINPPGVFGGFNVRTFETLAAGNVLFQYLPKNRPLNNALFKDAVHLVYFNKNDIGSLINKINLLINEPDAFKEIAENGHREFLQHHTLEKRLNALLSWIDRGEMPSYPNYAIKSKQGETHKQMEKTSVSINNLKKENSLIKVSAIVSTYNSEKFIRGCIDDLLNQTLYKKGELEIVVVVSGSEENEKQIIEEYRSGHSNIKLITTENKETIYQAWNRGIKAAEGKYITNANADDRHKEDAFEKMFEIFEKREETDVVYANVYNTQIMNDTFDSSTQKTVTSWVPFDKDLILFGCFLGPQPMWKKSLHNKFGMFDETLKVIGDYEFWLRISREANFHHINEILGLYFYSVKSAEHRDSFLTIEENKLVQKKYLTRFVNNLDDVKRINEKLELVKAAKDGEQYYKKAIDLINKREAGLRIEHEIKEFERLYQALSESEKSNKIEQFIRALSNNVIYIDSEYYLALMNKLMENNGANKNEFETHFESVINNLNHNKFNEAYEDLILCIKAFPEAESNKAITTLYDLFILAGNTALILNDFSSSKQYFEKALKAKPDSSKACFGLAELLFIERNFKPAKTMYEWAVNNDANDEQAMQGLMKVNKILELSENHNSLLIEQG